MDLGYFSHWGKEGVPDLRASAWTTGGSWQQGHYLSPIRRPESHFSWNDCHSGFSKRLCEPNMGLPSVGHAGQSTQAGFSDSQVCTLLRLWLPLNSREMPGGIHFRTSDTPPASRGPIKDATSAQPSPWGPSVPRRMVPFSPTLRSKPHRWVLSL